MSAGDRQQGLPRSEPEIPSRHTRAEDVHALLIGMGILSLARASVGGIGIVALYLQERRGVSAGIIQLASDVLVLGGAAPVIGPVRLLYSVISALALSLVMLAYHRPGRYTGY